MGKCQKRYHFRYTLFYQFLVFFFSRFVCDNCHKKKGTKRKENRFAAKRLPTTRLGNYIENRVNNFLRKKEADSGEVYIRVVYSGEKTVEVKQGMKTRYGCHTSCKKKTCENTFVMVFCLYFLDTSTPAR